MQKARRCINAYYLQQNAVIMRADGPFFGFEIYLQIAVRVCRNVNG